MIADADTKDGAKFLADLEKKSCYLIHLSEGVDDSARKHFLSLQFKPGQWAIAASLAGIHCNALTKEDFHGMASKKASMVWSPVSNYLLYGGTARVSDARSEGVRIGIGSDWSPSGSKNLLGELKIAKLFSEDQGGFLADRDIVALATTNAAAILKWDKALGSIEKGKRADLAVWSGTSADPYGALLKARESDLRLVLINGVPRYGAAGLMKKLGVAGESAKVESETRTLFLTQKTASAPVTSISLAEATATLKQAVKDFAESRQEAIRAAKRTEEHAEVAIGARNRDLGPRLG